MPIGEKQSKTQQSNVEKKPKTWNRYVKQPPFEQLLRMCNQYAANIHVVVGVAIGIVIVAHADFIVEIIVEFFSLFFTTILQLLWSEIITVVAFLLLFRYRRLSAMHTHIRKNNIINQLNGSNESIEHAPITANTNYANNWMTLCFCICIYSYIHTSPAGTYCI